MKKENKNENKISQSDLASVAGVSRKTVTLWKQKGHLQFNADGSIDRDETIAYLKERGLGNFEEVTDPDEEVTRTLSDNEIESELVTAMAELMKSDNFKMLSKAGAERFKENYAALRQRVSYEVDIKKLVNRRELELKHAEKWAMEKSAWLNWPSTIAGEIAAELDVDQAKFRILLENAVHAQLAARVKVSDAQQD